MWRVWVLVESQPTLLQSYESRKGIQKSLTTCNKREYLKRWNLMEIIYKAIRLARHFCRSMEWRCGLRESHKWLEASLCLHSMCLWNSSCLSSSFYVISTVLNICLHYLISSSQPPSEVTFSSSLFHRSRIQDPRTSSNLPKVTWLLWANEIQVQISLVQISYISRGTDFQTRVELALLPTMLDRCLWNVHG